MEQIKEKLSKEAKILDRYLKTYSRCVNRKHSLEKRRDEVRKEFENPLRSSMGNGMPRGSSLGVGCAALSFELDEINTKINEKIQEMKKEYAKINGIIDFLAEDSTEKAILEYKYIDRFSWAEICNVEHISKTPAVQYWRRGLYKLLEFAKVKAVIREYEKSISELN